MGQEISQEQIDPNTPPKTLSSRTLEGVAEYINDGQPKRIVVSKTSHPWDGPPA